MKQQALILFATLIGSAGQPQADPGASTRARERAERLIRLTRDLPDVRPQDAEVAAIAALAVEDEHTPAEVLLAIAWGESRFIFTTVTGRACGPMQTIPTSSLGCRAMQVPLIGFAAGAAELHEWLTDRRVHGDLHRALLGYACGNAAFDGTCRKTAWPGWVLRRARRLGWAPHQAERSHDQW